MEIIELPLCKLLPAPWNANQMDEVMLNRLKESVKRYGVVENLVVRKMTNDTFEIIGGNQRLIVLRETGYTTAPCAVVELNDAQARLLAQALNSLNGEDDLGLRSELMRQVLSSIPEKEVLAILPETTLSLETIVNLGAETIAEYLKQKQLAQAARLKHMQFQLTPDQLPVIEKTIVRILPKIQLTGTENPNQRGNALYYLCKYYLEKEVQE